MKIHIHSFVAITVFAIAISASAEKKIDRSELPPAVEKTVQSQSKGATIKNFLTERENGKQVYEVEMMVDGPTSKIHSKDLQIAIDGTLNEIEEQVSLDSLPGPVQQALNTKAAGAKIMKVESLTKHDKLVAYEAATLKGSRKGEIQVGPNGETLTHEE